MLAIVERDYSHPYPPRVSEFTKPFWDGLAGGRFMTTIGAQTRRYTFPPKPISPHDWNEGVQWVELSGKGTLYSYTTMHVVPAVFRSEAPYRICIVDLDEGLRIVTRLLDSGPVPLDQPVELVVVRYVDCVSYAARLVSASSL
jgi:uncharacterized OB-fold protein